MQASGALAILWEIQDRMDGHLRFHLERMLGIHHQVAALERAVQYAKERVVFGRPIGQNQAIAHPLAMAWAKLETAELITLKAAWLFDHGRPCGAESNTAKLLAAEAGFEACDVAVQTHGGYGYAKE